MAKLIINKGDRFGKLTVVNEDPFIRIPSGQINRVFKCKCDCGNMTIVRLVHLVRLRTMSCGCLNGEQHGDAGTKLHNTWRAMKNRCSLNYFQKQYYNEKNIKVCDEWSSSYLKFKKWALINGYKEGLKIDRIDNSKGYSPENCRFVTDIENVNNRDKTYYVTYNGEKISFMMLLRKKNLLSHAAAIRSRIARGYSVERAINTIIRKGNYKKEVERLKSEKI